MAKAAQSNTQQGILDESGEGFTFDMENQEADSGFPTLDKGVYDAIIDSVEYVISKNSGNPMWKVIHLITDPKATIENHKVTSYVVFKPDQMGRAKMFINRVAPEVATKDFNPKRVAEDGLLNGKPHRVRLDIRKSEEYGNSNEVKGVLSAGAGGDEGGAGDGGFKM